MKKTLTLLFLTAAFLTTKAQKIEIPNSILYLQAEQIIEDSLITKKILTSGIVKRVFYYAGDNSKFIELNKEYPNNPITVSVYKDTYKGNFETLEQRLKGKNVMVWGTINSYPDGKGGSRLGIYIYEDKQIIIVP